MAQIGLRNFRYAQLKEDGETYEKPATLSGAIESKASLNIANAKLHADDVVKENVNEFIDGTLTLGLDDDDDEIFSPLLGEKTETYTTSGDNEIIVYKSNSDDVAKYFGFGQVVVKIKENKKYYKVEWFPKIQFKPFSTDKKTKGDSLEFTTPSVEGTIFTNKNNDWRYKATFDNQADAEEFLDSLFVQSA